MKKDKIDSLTRRAKRDAIINAVFQEMLLDGKSFMESYALLGDLTGLGHSQLSTIIDPRKSQFPLAGTNVSYLAVLLQRISEKLTKNAESYE